MKYFIGAVLCVVFATAGFFGSKYYFVKDFEAKSGVSYEAFNGAREQCMAQAKESCKMYGGFAPASQFSK